MNSLVAESTETDGGLLPAFRGSHVKTSLFFIGALSCGAIRMADFDSTDANLKKLLGHESEQERERESDERDVILVEVGIWGLSHKKCMSLPGSYLWSCCSKVSAPKHSPNTLNLKHISFA